MHSFFHSFVHYSSIHQSFIIHFSSRSAVGGRVDSERWLHLAQKDGKEAAEGERERERGVGMLRCAAENPNWFQLLCPRKCPDSCHAE
jgi:hypothetical protein